MNGPGSAPHKNYSSCSNIFISPRLRHLRPFKGSSGGFRWINEERTEAFSKALAAFKRGRIGGFSCLWVRAGKRADAVSLPVFVLCVFWIR